MIKCTVFECTVHVCMHTVTDFETDYIIHVSRITADYYSFISNMYCNNCTVYWSTHINMFDASFNINIFYYTLYLQ